MCINRDELWLTKQTGILRLALIFLSCIFSRIPHYKSHSIWYLPATLYMIMRLMFLPVLLYTTYHIAGNISFQYPLRVGTIVIISTFCWRGKPTFYSREGSILPTVRQLVGTVGIWLHYLVPLCHTLDHGTAHLHLLPYTTGIALYFIYCLTVNWAT